MLKDEHDKPHLKITQRLRLDEAKLEDVSKRINSSSSHAIFLALAAASGSVPVPEGAEVQSRPLKNLVRNSLIKSLVNREDAVSWGVNYHYSGLGNDGLCTTTVLTLCTGELLEAEGGGGRHQPDRAGHFWRPVRLPTLQLQVIK